MANSWKGKTYGSCGLVQRLPSGAPPSWDRRANLNKYKKNEVRTNFERNFGFWKEFYSKSIKKSTFFYRTALSVVSVLVRVRLGPVLLGAL